MANKTEATAFFSQKAIMTGGALAQDEIQKYTTETVAKIVAAIPAESRANYSEDPTVAAYEYYEEYEKKLNELNGGSNTGAGAPGAATGLATAQTTTSSNIVNFVKPTLSSALDNAITELLESSQDERIQRGYTAKVEKITLARPSYGPLLAELRTTEVEPDVAPDKLKAWEDALFDNSKTAAEDGFNSKVNFDKLKASIGKHKLPIYTTRSRTLVGAVVSWDEKDNGKDTRITRQFDMNGLKGFLNTKVFTRIGTNEENGLGVEVVRMVTKNIASDAGTLGAGNKKEHIVRLRWDTGKKDVLDQGEKSPYINFRDDVIRENGKIQVSKDARTVRLDLPFKITKKVTVDGNVDERQTTQRPTGKVQLPLFHRANQEMVSVFGPDTKAPISSRFGEKEKREAAEMQKDFMAAVMAGEMDDVSSYGADLLQTARDLRKIDAAAAPDVSAFVG